VAGGGIARAAKPQGGVAEQLLRFGKIEVHAMLVPGLRENFNRV